MEIAEILDVWKSQHEKVEFSLKLNRELLESSIHRKAELALQPLIKLKTIVIAITIPYLLILAFALFFAVRNYDSSKSYFIVSVSAILLVNIKALIDYITHLRMAKKIDFNDTVVKVQQQLSALQFSIINHGKIMCLQFPFFTTFYLSNKWFPDEIGFGYIIFQILLTGTFIYVSYHLYKSQTIENINKKWFRKMIAVSGGNSVLKAIDFYKELEQFKDN